MAYGEKRSKTSVSRCGLDEDIARLQATRALSILDHASSNTILDRPSRIEELALGHLREREGREGGKGSESRVIIKRLG